MQINTVIFDLGAVLVDWNPRYVYRQLFRSEEAVEHFLGNVCTNHWNEQQDGGRSFEDATAILVREYPHYNSEINAYYGRWEEMLKGQIDDSVQLLEELKASNKFQIYALTNWSAESFPVALERFPFLSLFDGIVVSGDEKMKKPHHEIYRLLMERYNVVPSEAIFIDDNYQNILAAEYLGIRSIHFQHSQQCRDALSQIINW
ncbi:MAG: HAD family phosphatase [Saprospiraceae bacterium]|nr:HAD family phosphatase [Saprospiraceae bacterium]